MNPDLIAPSTTTGVAESGPRHSDFRPTRWTLVSRAQGETPEARAALSELCDAYYQAVLAFLRKEQSSADRAQELAQEFFARILSGNGFAGADQAQGRFRTYVLGALKHFLAETRARARRLKRGGGVTPESLDALKSDENGETSEWQLPDSSTIAPDASFDREWALEVMKRGLFALEQEMLAKNKREHFELFKPWLTGEHAELSHAEAGLRLSLSESAVKVAVHRLRKRFGELIRNEITQTLRDPSQAAEELQHLVAALS